VRRRRPVDAGRLAHLPVLVRRGDDRDDEIPLELLDRTWTYLFSESVASTAARQAARLVTL
jgi:phospholipase/carboxylesterase